jgi:hypothetical protein
MKFLIFTSKYTNGRVYKNYLIGFGCILFTCTIMSCHNQTQQNVTENLNILYLNNTTANPELKQLLNATKNRVSFQFYHDVSGIFNLDAWPMKDSLGNYNKHSAKLLHETDVLGVSITNVNVNLGNIHIVKSGRDSLLTDTNKAGFQYILFYPKIQTDTVKGVNNIVYDIYGSATLPTKVNPFVPVPANVITSAGNPSPPYQAF